MARTLNPEYRKLFAAYLTGMVGNGIVVVALALVAFDIAGAESAATVIATTLTIKMIAYVVGSPVSVFLLSGFSQRRLLVVLDLIRAGVLLLAPFVETTLQLFALVAVFALASAAYTPAYQATVPQILTDPHDYARAIAKSRIANELENAISPLIAAALLLVLSARGVFVVSFAAFLGAAFLVSRLSQPHRVPASQSVPRKYAKPTYLFTDPTLRGLIPLAIGTGLGAALVTVNTVPLVHGQFALTSERAALALAVFGAGSVLGALALPRLMETRTERWMMLGGGIVLVLALLASAWVDRFGTLLAAWAAAGFGVALAQVPAAAVIRRNTTVTNRLVTYAMHFAVTNFGLAIGYASVGVLEAHVSLSAASLVIAAASACCTALAAVLWPKA